MNNPERAIIPYKPSPFGPKIFFDRTIRGEVVFPTFECCESRFNLNQPHPLKPNILWEPSILLLTEPAGSWIEDRSRPGHLISYDTLSTWLYQTAWEVDPITRRPIGPTLEYITKATLDKMEELYATRILAPEYKEPLKKLIDEVKSFYSVLLACSVAFNTFVSRHSEAEEKMQEVD